MTSLRRGLLFRAGSNLATFSVGAGTQQGSQDQSQYRAQNHYAAHRGAFWTYGRPAPPRSPRCQPHACRTQPATAHRGRELVVEAKKLGLELEDLQEAIADYWQKLAPRRPRRSRDDSDPQLTKRFGAVEAIEDLTLTVPESSVFALIGPMAPAKPQQSRRS